MAYPVAATLIASAPPPWGFNQPLYPLQIVGTVLLLAVIVCPELDEGEGAAGGPGGGAQAGEG